MRPSAWAWAARGSTTWARMAWVSAARRDWVSVAFRVIASASTEKCMCSRRSIIVDSMAMPMEPPRLRIMLDSAEASAVSRGGRPAVDICDSGTVNSGWPAARSSWGQDQLVHADVMGEADVDEAARREEQRAGHDQQARVEALHQERHGGKEHELRQPRSTSPHSRSARRCSPGSGHNRPG